MVGYWLVWCGLIVTILVLTGYKEIVLKYISKKEGFLNIVVVVLLMIYPNQLVIQYDNGLVQLYIGGIVVIVSLLMSIFRTSLQAICLMLLTGSLLGLMYALFYAIFLVYRGYEPSMVEWLVYVCLFVIVLNTVIEKKQLLPVIMIAQTVGELILYWHQQGQYSVKFGELAWLEFVTFLFISSICLNESLLFIAKRLNLFANNKMKS